MHPYDLQSQLHCCNLEALCWHFTTSHDSVTMKRRTLYLSALLMVFVLVFGTAISSNAMLMSGDPLEHNSWAQSFWGNIGQYDHIQIMFNPEPHFEVPVAIERFSQTGWSQTYNDGSLLIADGLSATQDLFFNLVFVDPRSDDFTFHYQAWYGDTVVDNADAYWSGRSWSITGPTGGTWESDRIDNPVSATPEPASLLLLSAGLAGFAVYRRKVRN